LITIKVQDILTKDTDTIDPTCEPFCIYVVREEATALYIGRSKDPIYRLWQHFNQRGGAGLGIFYQEYKDESLEWDIDLYTVAECETLLQTRLQEAWKAELSMIEHFHPSLNSNNNPNPGKLPGRYQKRKLNLDNNAVDVLNF
jgi:predicted GIY-YIG superfamily endonuclease